MTCQQLSTVKNPTITSKNKQKNNKCTFESFNSTGNHLCLPLRHAPHFSDSLRLSLLFYTPTNSVCEQFAQKERADCMHTKTYAAKIQKLSNLLPKSKIIVCNSCYAK